LKPAKPASEDAPPSANGHADTIRKHWRGWFPALETEDRRTLAANLTEGSRWSVNFGMMLGCSVIIAGLGLLQDSVAVIIGAMLVAPLMTPLIGIGMALVQGNFDLLVKAARSMLRGTLVSLALGVLLRLLVPGSEMTSQVTLRGAANILDLLIAFFAGVAAGYAMARPKLSGALPGVAIAVALVPPLTAAGIAFGCTEWIVGLGALLLYTTNMVAIVLGSALVFRMHGIKTTPSRRTYGVTMKRIIFSLGAILLILIAPLGWQLLDQIRQGQIKPSYLTLSEEMWENLDDRLEREEGIDFLGGARASSRGPEDVTLVITANRMVPGELIAELDQLIDEGMGTDIDVKINVLRQGEVGVLPPEFHGKKPEEVPPAINE
jgi:uncharacterized hydrophobic protein (TIGR00271 family)